MEDPLPGPWPNWTSPLAQTGPHSPITPLNRNPNPPLAPLPPPIPLDRDRSPSLLTLAPLASPEPDRDATPLLDPAAPGARRHHRSAIAKPPPCRRGDGSRGPCRGSGLPRRPSTTTLTRDPARSYLAPTSDEDRAAGAPPPPACFPAARRPRHPPRAPLP